MIRIERGPEPDALTRARDEHLARARLRAKAPKAAAISGYDAARAPLEAVQHQKCAYCELYVRVEGAPVEHYRPKGDAWDVQWDALGAIPKRKRRDADDEDDARFVRGLPPLDARFGRVRWAKRSGYWWLAWTWENAVFGCSGCNSGVKGTRFPQAHGAIALKGHEAPPSDERPLLLDPTAIAPEDDPIKHIRFREVAGRWRPTPRDGSARGAWTIALLRLDSSPTLLTAYGTRVKALQHAARAVDALRKSDDDALGAAWTTLLDDVLAPNEQLLGLTWDWLDARYPEPWRASFNLPFPKPVLRDPTAPPATPRPATAVIPTLNGLPATLADHIRVARNYQTQTGQKFASSVEQRPLAELIAGVLALRPDAPDAELAALLLRSEATVRQHRPR